MTHNHLRFTVSAPDTDRPPFFGIDYDWRDAEGIYAEESNGSIQLRGRGYAELELLVFPRNCPECARSLVVGMQTYERLYNEYVRERERLQTEDEEDITVQMGEG